MCDARLLHISYCLEIFNAMNQLCQTLPGIFLDAGFLHLTLGPISNHHTRFRQEISAVEDLAPDFVCLTLVLDIGC